MKKKIKYALLVILIIIITAGYIGIQKFNNTFFGEKPNYLTYAFDSKPIKFIWTNQTLGNNYETQTAMFVSSKIEGLSHKFYMQFDTGSPYSFIYEGPLNSLKTLGINVKEIVRDNERYVESLDFILDKNHIKAKMIKVLPNYGKSFNENDTTSIIKIGTIGSDFIANRITAIDFKNQNIKLFNKRPEWMLSLSKFKPFDFTARRIMLPVILDDKTYEFLYDSGCSAFGLITIKKRFEKYTREDSKVIQYGANSWGNSISIITKPTDKLFNIGNTNLSLKRVSYVDMYSKLQPLITPFTKIGGWLGNQPFNESTLILDTQLEEFIVIKE